MELVEPARPLTVVFLIGVIFDEKYFWATLELIREIDAPESTKKIRLCSVARIKGSFEFK